MPRKQLFALSLIAMIGLAAAPAAAQHRGGGHGRTHSGISVHLGGHGYARPAYRGYDPYYSGRYYGRGAYAPAYYDQGYYGGGYYGSGYYAAPYYDRRYRNDRRRYGSGHHRRGHRGRHR